MKKRKTKLKRQDKQLIWFFVIIAVVFISFLVSWYYFQSLKKFEFAGVNFEKVKEFNIDFYRGVFFVPTYQNQYKHYSFYLRNDPRKNNVPVEGKIVVNPNITISLEVEASQCYYADVAHIELSRFLGAFDQISLEGGFTDEEMAKATNVTYATCEHADSKKHTVIVVQKSETPSIVQEKPDCYVIRVGDCENIKAAEKFMITIMAQINKVDI